MPLNYFEVAYHGVNTTFRFCHYVHNDTKYIPKLVKFYQFWFMASYHLQIRHHICNYKIIFEILYIIEVYSTLLNSCHSNQTLAGGTTIRSTSVTQAAACRTGESSSTHHWAFYMHMLY